MPRLFATWNVFVRRPLLAVVAAILFPLLSGCVYFNTYYNAQKAYDQARRLHDRRLDKNPEDSIIVSDEEKTKLERCITKSSKVLELYPGNKKYPPKALFLIGESYLMEGEYAKAIEKYDELQRFYPRSADLPVARFHRAKSLFLNGQYPFARLALEEILATTRNQDFRREAMTLLAQMQVKNDSPAVALELYEKLLREEANTVLDRARLHVEAAKLAFSLKLWDKAREHAKAKEIAKLPGRIHYHSDMLAVDCLFRLGKIPQGIAELQVMRKDNLYFKYVPEIDLKQAEGLMALGNTERALALLMMIPRAAPRTAYAAEAYFRLGEYHLRKLADEKRAKIFYDSAAAAGTQFEFGLKAQDRSQALSRLATLRKPDTAKADTGLPVQYKNFMIAELFLFKLDNIDSSLNRLDRIVVDKRKDSVFTMRAAYARAFIRDEFKQDTVAADSQYRYVLEHYPNTEYAKQAERNLGLKPSVKTDEDKAHQLFLAAEALRFGGESPRNAAAAYQKVVAEFGDTRDAAKAEFVMAMLYEKMAFGEENAPDGADLAKAAYVVIRDKYPESPYYTIADAKLEAAGVKRKSAVRKRAPAPGSESQPAATGENPTPSPEVMENATTPSAVDSTASQPDENPKEKLETD